MIKRILLLISAYAILTVVITVNFSQEKFYISILVIINTIFAVTILFLIYKYFRFSKQHILSDKKLFLRNDVVFANITFDNDILLKISQQPFLFGIEQKLIANKDFFYDKDYFYVIGQDGAVDAYRLEDISELSRTSTQINNSRIWQIKISVATETVEYRFVHNFSIWNKNFLKFYNKVKQIRPEAIKSKWSLWMM